MSLTAVVYALLSPEQLEVEAIYAAPFFNDRSSGPEDGMEKSYEEILKIHMDEGSIFWDLLGSDSM